MFNRICFLVLFCFLVSPTSIYAGLPEPSPAGGNYLALDGKDDYAVLDFDTFGVLFKGGTKELTVEAWIYPTLIPDKDSVAVILGQQIVIYAVGNGHPIHQDAKNWIKLNNDDLALLMFAYTGTNSSTGSMYLALSRNKWHHIAFQVSDRQLAWICDNTWDSLPWGIGGIADDLSKVMDIPSKDFVLGGYGEKTGLKDFTYGSFAGYIDEVRISTIPRYDTTKGNLIPKGRFESDENTVALWHFDERNGQSLFYDSSSNKYDLIGENQASIGGPFAVNSNDKLTTTWSAIKIYGD